MKSVFIGFFFLTTSLLFAQGPHVNYEGPYVFDAGRVIVPVTPKNLGGAPVATGYRATTLAGTGKTDFSSGRALESGINNPLSVSVDASGNLIVIDGANNLIRKISQDGTIQTIAGGMIGSAEGPTSTAGFSIPYDAISDETGVIYVADFFNNKIRKITPDGSVTTLAGSDKPGLKDSIGAYARFNKPRNLAFAPDGSILVADCYNHCIRKVTKEGVVTTVAGTGKQSLGNGPAATASFVYPSGVIVDRSGNIIVSEASSAIRKITPSGQVTTLAGTFSNGYNDATGASARFNYPMGMDIDTLGNIYIADSYNMRIRKLTPEGVVSTVAGSGAVGRLNSEALLSSFNNPVDVACDKMGNLYVADSRNNLIRKIIPAKFKIEPTLPDGLFFDWNTGILSGKPLSESPETNYRIVSANASGTDTCYLKLTIRPTPVVYTQKPTFVKRNSVVLNGRVERIGTPIILRHGFCWSESAMPSLEDHVLDLGSDTIGGLFTTTLEGLAPNHQYTIRAFATNAFGAVYGDSVRCLTSDELPNIHYDSLSMKFTIGHAIDSVRLLNNGGKTSASAYVSTFTGNGQNVMTNGTVLNAGIRTPMGIAGNRWGDFYVVDTYGSILRKIDRQGTVSTFAGSGTHGSTDGFGTSASFRDPLGLTVAQDGTVYMSDQQSHKILRISPAGMVVTLAGSGSMGSVDSIGKLACFNQPSGIVVDAAGTVFVADYSNNLIRKITSDGRVTTLAGSKKAISLDGKGLEAGFNGPYGIALGDSGMLYITETLGGKVRKVASDGTVTTIAGSGENCTIDGLGKEASFNNPTGIVFGDAGILYVTEPNNGSIRQITPDGRVKTLFAPYDIGFGDGPGKLAKFVEPYAICKGYDGAFYIADRNNCRIRKMTLGRYLVNPSLPAGMHLDSETGAIGGIPLTGSANQEYKVYALNGFGLDSIALNITVYGPPVVHTLNLTLTPTSAEAKVELADLGFPSPTTIGICWNKTGEPTVQNECCDLGSYDGRMLYPASILNLEPSTKYHFRAYASNRYGTAYGMELVGVTPRKKPDLRYEVPAAMMVGTKISPIIPVNLGGVPDSLLLVTNLAGTGQVGALDTLAPYATFNNPTGIALDSAGCVYVADASNHRIRKIDLEGTVTTFAGTGVAGSNDGVASSATFNTPQGLVFDNTGSLLVADTYNQKIRKISRSGMVSTLAGSGVAGIQAGDGAVAKFNNPVGLAVDTFGMIYVADQNNHRIRKVSPSGFVYNYWGVGTKGSGCSDTLKSWLGYPSGVCVGVDGTVYVADYANRRVAKATKAGVVTNFVGIILSAGYSDGNGTLAHFKGPFDITMDQAGCMFVTDLDNNLIRKVTTSADVTTIAGNRVVGYADGEPLNSSFSSPSGIATDTKGNVYITDKLNHRIRKICYGNYSIKPALPSGLFFNHQTGSIDGMPLKAAPLTDYTITGSNSTGLFTTVVSFAVLDTVNSLAQTSQVGCRLYPNPATSEIYLSGISPATRVDIYTLTGVKVWTKTVSSNEALGIGRLAPGIYVVKVDGFELKLVKQ